ITGILSTTMRKKIGQNPVKSESVGSSPAGFDGEPTTPGDQRFGFCLLQPEGGIGRHQEGRLVALPGPAVTAVVEVVVDPGERPAAPVLVERPELPVGRAEPGGAVEG